MLLGFAGTIQLLWAYAHEVGGGCLTLSAVLDGSEASAAAFSARLAARASSFACFAANATFTSSAAACEGNLDAP